MTDERGTTDVAESQATGSSSVRFTVLYQPLVIMAGILRLVQV